MNDSKLTNEEFEELIDMAKSRSKTTAVSIFNPLLGEILLPHGKRDTKDKMGFGYEHIVCGRLFKDNQSNDEIASLIVKMLEILKSANGKEIKKENGTRERMLVEKDGIRVVLSKEKLFEYDVWVLTGYPMFEQGTKTIKEVAKASLRTVIATKEYAQYYSYFRSIVGALTTDLIIEKNKQNVNGGQEI